MPKKVPGTAVVKKEEPDITVDRNSDARWWAKAHPTPDERFFCLLEAGSFTAD